MVTLWEEVVTGQFDMASLDPTVLADRGVQNPEGAGFALIYAVGTYGVDLEEGSAHLRDWCVSMPNEELPHRQAPAVLPAAEADGPVTSCVNYHSGFCEEPTPDADRDPRGVCVINDDRSQTCTEVDDQAEAPAAPDSYFTSPSGNIACSLNGSGATCSALEHDWSVQSHTAPIDCGDGFEAGASVSDAEPAVEACQPSRDGQAAPLAFGKSITAGVMRCTSERSGVTCRSSQTDYGFTISKASLRTF